MGKLRTLETLKETKEKVTFTFSGWDGKSYNGEPCTMSVWRETNGNNQDKKYVVTYWRANCGLWILHEIDESCLHEVSGFPSCHVVGEHEKDRMK